MTSDELKVHPASERTEQVATSSSVSKRRVWPWVVLAIVGATFLSRLPDPPGPSPNPNPSPSPSPGPNSPEFGNWRLSCVSLELYRHFASEFDQFGFQGSSEEYRQNVEDGNCKLLVDNDIMTKIGHVEKRDGNYLCVREATEPRCRWTDATKLRFIGFGPQVSDELFAEVERLLAEAKKLRTKAKVYEDQADDISYDQNGKPRQLNAGERDQRDALEHQAILDFDLAMDLQKRALAVGTSPRPK